MKKLIIVIIFLLMSPLHAEMTFKDFHRAYLASTAKSMINSRRTNFEKAEKRFAELAKTATSPEDKAKWTAWQAIALGYQEGKRDEAMKLAESAGDIPDAKYAMIRIMAHQKEWKALAEKFKDEDLSKWRDEIRIPALTLRATALSVAEDYSAAISDYEAYLKEQEATRWEWIQAAGSIASCYTKAGEDKKALEAYQRIFDTAEKIEGGWVSSSYHARAMINASTILRGQKKLEEALKVMSSGKILSPSTVGSVIETRGDILAEMGKIEDAIAEYKKAIELCNKPVAKRYKERYKARVPHLEKKIKDLEPEETKNEEAPAAEN